MRKTLFVLFGLLFGTYAFAQKGAFDNEVTENNGKIYFEGKPFTGVLFSSQDGIPNDCDCTLKASYKNGLLHGLKREWHVNGKLKFKGKYENGKPVGTHVYLDDKGKTIKKLTYHNGALQEKTLYYANGRIKKKEVYENGRVIQAVIYNRDGSIKGATHEDKTRQADEKPKRNKKPDVPSGPDNELTNRANPINSRNANGLQYEYFDNGRIKRILLKQNGLPVKDSVFYENGQVRSVKKYINGELVHTEWHSEAGVLLKEENFMDNKKHGVQRENYSDGSAKRLEIYEFGFLSHREEFGPNGKPVLEENYRFGKKDGVQKYYDPTGNLTEWSEYRNGILIQRRKKTPEGEEITKLEGEIFSVKTFDAGNNLIRLYYLQKDEKTLDSLWVEFDPVTRQKTLQKKYRNGKLIEQGRFLNGHKNGTWVYYAPDSTYEKREIYRNGKIIKRQKLIYGRQLKKLYKEGDYLFQYHKYADSLTEYVILRIPPKEGKEYEYIAQALVKAMKTRLQPVRFAPGLEDEQVFSLIRVDSLSSKLKRNGKRYLYLIYISLQHTDFETGESQQQSWMVLPGSSSENIKEKYVRDKKDAFFNTVNALYEKMKSFTHRTHPFTALAKRKKGTQKEVTEVYINAGTRQGIKEKDIFYTKPNASQTVIIKITVAGAQYSVGKVVQGKELLRTLMQESEKIKVFKR